MLAAKLVDGKCDWKDDSKEALAAASEVAMAVTTVAEMVAWTKVKVMIEASTAEMTVEQ